MSEYTPDPITSNDSRRTTSIILGIFAGLAIVLIVALVVLLFLDPFGWNLFGRSKADAIANAVPPEVPFYLGVDLSRLNCDQLAPIVWAFSEELKEEGKCGLDDIYQELDDSLEGALGFTFTEDVKPWVGREIGVGIVSLEIDSWGGVETVDFLVIIESRAESEADEFLLKFGEGLSEETGDPVLEETYAGRTIYKLDATYEDERLVFTRSDNLVLFSQAENVIKNAIDVQDGESLADTRSYQQLVAELPADRSVTLYINGEEYGELYGDLFGGLSGMGITELYGESLEDIPDTVVGLSIVDVGVQMDMVFAIDPDALPDNGISVFPTITRTPRILSFVPEDALFSINGASLNLIFEDFKENYGQQMGMEDFEQSMMFFEEAFGFDPFEDLLAKLDGEWAFDVVPSSEGALAEEMDIPFGFAFIAETSDPESLLQVASVFSLRLETQGMGEVELVESEKTKLYELVDMFSGQRVVAFGVGDGHFLIGSSVNTLNEMFSGRPSLVEGDGYKQVMRAFPKDTVPIVYVDIQGFVANVRESMTPADREDFDQEAGAMWRSMTQFAIGASSPTDEAVKITMILFIDTD